MKSRLRLVAVAIAVAALSPLLAGAEQDPHREYVWLEGEDSPRHTFNQHGWYSSSGVRLDLMSPGGPGAPGTDGNWLAHYDGSGALAEASYDFTVARGGSYTFWIRTSAYQVHQWYQVDDGSRTEMDLESDLRERINLIAPARPDIRFLAWVNVGDLDVAAGDHTLTIGLEHHPSRQPGEVHGGIDAICITSFPWAPAGTLQPRLEPGPEPAPDAWYPYVPTEDTFSDESITDMSRLLHRPAGVHGPVHQVGDKLAFADGTEVKFWGLGASIPASDETMDLRARYYAKHGVNLVRLHPVQAVAGLLQRDPASGEHRLDPARVARLDRWFAALKAAGIYMTWSPVYPHVITADDGYPAELFDELPARGAGKSTSGYVNYMHDLQQAEWHWLRALLLHRNAYTGLRYIDDPALAVVEVHNEDSVFWHWPLNSLATGSDAPLHTAALKRMWATWLQGRYASDAELLAAWGPVGGGSRAGDSLGNPGMPIYGAWEMAADGPSQNRGEKQRMGDFIRFLAETQSEYFDRRQKQLRTPPTSGRTTAWTPSIGTRTSAARTVTRTCTGFCPAPCAAPRTSPSPGAASCPSAYNRWKTSRSSSASGTRIHPTSGRRRSLR
jgi:hypothetical protein